MPAGGPGVNAGYKVMAKVTAEIKNLNRALEKLGRVVVDTQAGALRGLLAGGLLVQRRAQKRTPVEYGLLRASAFTRRAQDGSLAVEVGYAARYARAVHEKTAEKLRGKRRRSGLGTYWNPGESRFLDKAYRESLGEVIGLVRKFSQHRERTGG